MSTVDPIREALLQVYPEFCLAPKVVAHTRAVLETEWGAHPALTDGFIEGLLAWVSVSGYRNQDAGTLTRVTHFTGEPSGVLVWPTIEVGQDTKETSRQELARAAALLGWVLPTLGSIIGPKVLQMIPHPVSRRDHIVVPKATGVVEFVCPPDGSPGEVVDFDNQGRRLFIKWPLAAGSGVLRLTSVSQTSFSVADNSWLVMHQLHDHWFSAHPG